MNLQLRIVGVKMMIAATLIIAGCDRAELTGPPELRLGRYQCIECGMLISEDRCSSAMVIEIDGVREHVLFDDIGCMLDYDDSDDRGSVVIERYVHDYGTRAWVVADAAWFVTAAPERLATPMGSGFVAFADAAAAERARGDCQGVVLHYRDLATRRAAGSNRPGSPEDSGAAGG